MSRSDLACPAMNYWKLPGTTIFQRSELGQSIYRDLGAGHNKGVTLLDMGACTRHGQLSSIVRGVPISEKDHLHTMVRSDRKFLQSAIKKRVRRGDFLDDVAVTNVNLSHLANQTDSAGEAARHIAAHVLLIAGIDYVVAVDTSNDLVGSIHINDSQFFELTVTEYTHHNVEVIVFGDPWHRLFQHVSCN
jgi:hypothetical protein